jgi:hypothetical protein
MLAKGLPPAIIRENPNITYKMNKLCTPHYFVNPFYQITPQKPPGANIFMKNIYKYQFRATTFIFI